MHDTVIMMHFVYLKRLQHVTREYLLQYKALQIVMGLMIIKPATTCSQLLFIVGYNV